MHSELQKEFVNPDAYHGILFNILYNDSYCQFDLI
jgi:hypothetical protein